MATDIQAENKKTVEKFVSLCHTNYKIRHCLPLNDKGLSLE